MREAFHSKKELRNKSAVNYNINRRTMMALLTRRNSIIDNIKKNIMTKEELNNYYKYSEKLRKRHSFCFTKNKKQKKKSIIGQRHFGIKQK